jgi:hypothetical protein
MSVGARCSIAEYGELPDLDVLSSVDHMAAIRWMVSDRHCYLFPLWTE